MGEALHWFPVEEFLKNVVGNLLAEEGRLVVVGYYRKGIWSATSAPLDDVYKEFYEKIAGHCKFDQSDLYNEYPSPKYNFHNYFSKVTKQTLDYTLTLRVDDIVSYLQTYSFYNLYLQSNPHETDPIDLVRQRLHNHPDAVLETRYFVYSCEGPKVF